MVYVNCGAQVFPLDEEKAKALAKQPDLLIC